MYKTFKFQKEIEWKHANIVWYEDIKNIYKDQDIYFGGYKLEPMVL